MIVPIEIFSYPSTDRKSKNPIVIIRVIFKNSSGEVRFNTFSIEDFKMGMDFLNQFMDALHSFERRQKRNERGFAI